MATDEAVFQETVKNEKCPALRFYLSAPVAVSIGYFQDAKKEINLEGCRADNIDVVRRMTGGKAVFHDREITYSLAASSREKNFPTTSWKLIKSSAGVSPVAWVFWESVRNCHEEA